MLNRAYLLGPVLALALLPSNVVSAALPLLRSEWGATAAAAGWIFAAYQVGYLVGVVVLLPLTDRVRAGRVVAASAALTAVASLLLPLLATGVWSAAGVRFAAGVGLAGIYMPGVRAVAGAAGARRGLVVGGYVSAFYLGAAISLWVTGLLLPALGWRGAALVLAGASLLAVPLALVATAGLEAPSGGRARLDFAVLREGPVMRTVSAYSGHSWELYISRGWLAAFVAAVLAAGGASATAASSVGSQWAALMIGLGTIGVWLGGWVSDHVGRARVALAIALASGLCSLGFGFSAAWAWTVLVGFGCLYGLLLGADSSTYSTAITELAPPGRLGSAQAVQAFLGFGASVLAPIAAGFALDLGLGWVGVFVLAGAVGIVLALPLAPLALPGIAPLAAGRKVKS